MSKNIYVAFNKPYGILSQFTSDNPQETLANFNLPKEIYAAGRLDKDSEGLLLLTNDGELIHQAANPKFEKEKTYWVQVEKIPNTLDLEKLSKGILIGDYKTKICKVQIMDPAPNVTERNPPIRERKTIPTSWLEIKITEGKNRQVRKMTAAIGFPTLRLIRVQIGKLKLGDLKSGEFRFITRDEIL